MRLDYVYRHYSRFNREQSWDGLCKEKEESLLCISTLILNFELTIFMSGVANWMRLFLIRSNGPSCY